LRVVKLVSEKSLAIVVVGLLLALSGAAVVP
jgi:hypothetical protein